MKNKILLILAFLFTGLLSAHDSTKISPEAKAKKVSEKMKSKYALTDAQYAKIYNANLDFFKKREELRGKDSISKQKVDKRKALETARDAKYKEVLTSAQYTKWSNEKNDKEGDKDEQYRANGKNKNKSNGEGNGEGSGERSKSKGPKKVKSQEGDDDHRNNGNHDDDHNESDSSKHE